MKHEDLNECLTFFNELRLKVTETTNTEEKALGQKTVVVEYTYRNHTYITKKLYYQEISRQGEVNKPQAISRFFGEEVYWLDIKVHQWPHGPGAEIEKLVIEDMYEGDNPAFNSFLKTIANNQKTGFLQRIMWDGRSQQYGFNLTNNNHWHDLILLIQEFIRLKGIRPEKAFFKDLVFNWKSEERRSMHHNFGSRAITYELLLNLRKFNSMNDLYQLLLNKKQIILQGPPGTGKTYAAKNLAEQIIFGKEGKHKDEQMQRLNASDQFALVQFHPAYTYEDFVRGIVAKVDNGQVVYETENKLLANFAAIASENIQESAQQPFERDKREWIKEKLQAFAEQVDWKIVDDTLDKNEWGKYELTPSVSLVEVESDAFRYTGGNWSEKTASRMKFSDIVEGYYHEVQSRTEFRQLSQISGTAKRRSSYYFKVLEKFRQSIKDEYKQPKRSRATAAKKYVLLIDEINRANLPAVLGELIYALEYRNESVKSLYAIDGDHSITLPDNLYIIGTMNTADRSVGHIDYAIKRRFAFYTVLPNENVISNEKAYELFKQTAALFIETKDGIQQSSSFLSPEFDYKDVQLGHSYFMLQSKGDKEEEAELAMKLQYEILPVLREYLKDGILLETAEEYIEKLAEFGR